MHVEIRIQLAVKRKTSRGGYELRRIGERRDVKKLSGRPGEGGPAPVEATATKIAGGFFKGAQEVKGELIVIPESQLGDDSRNLNLDGTHIHRIKQFLDATEVFRRARSD